jgi:hypothetical protein
VEGPLLEKGVELHLKGEDSMDGLEKERCLIECSRLVQG